MLGNREKTMVISSTANEWPQNQTDHDQTALMASTGSRVMEKPSIDHQQPLKCPRCDSSNTKFCYYNNYSLSQPRHFCKACKRYWTRGGTLRNVPVGGGYRKNKRIKRPVASSSTDAAPSSSSFPPPPPLQTAISNHINPLFYGLPNGYDLQPKLNGLGLGFSSAKMTSDGHEDEYRSGFNPNSHLSNYSFFGSSSSSSSSPTIASLIASNLEQQKSMLGGLEETQVANHFRALLPFEDLQMAESTMIIKDVKMEEENNRMGTKLEYWNIPCQNQIEPIGSSDHQSLYWNATNVGSWPDISNYGSSATPLI